MEPLLSLVILARKMVGARNSVLSLTLNEKAVLISARLFYLRNLRLSIPSDQRMSYKVYRHRIALALMKQATIAGLAFDVKKMTTKRDKFHAEMDNVVP